ncbi:MAG: hypothetical protein IPK17_37435 [Chloroflexi bacterium]|uniref:hypothetical protein n=1 Tax=Candidatus Flexifilum breve TaxID=3140694 RepID=UPI003134844B|nr:hypothetical protein [Chloroflexota bacterium]
MKVVHHQSDAGRGGGAPPDDAAACAQGAGVDDAAADPRAGKPVEEFAPEGVPVVRVPIGRHLDFGVIGRLRTALRQPAKPDIAHTHLLHADLWRHRGEAGARTPHGDQSAQCDDQFRTLIPMRLVNTSCGGWPPPESRSRSRCGVLHPRGECQAQKNPPIHYGRATARWRLASRSGR